MNPPFIPPQARPLEESTRTFFVGIQGPPGSGKTSAALTFPEPIILQWEKSDIQGLIDSNPGLAGVKPLTLPFYNRTWITSTFKVAPQAGKPFNRVDSLLAWLRGDAQKLASSQTLVFDSWTTYQEAIDEVIFHPSEQIYSDKTGKADHFHPWDRKIDLSVETTTLLSGLACNVVVLFHEMRERDKESGRILDKLQPLQQGKYVTKLKILYPIFIRQHCFSKKDATGKSLENQAPDYMWQTRGSDDFDCKFVGKMDRPMFVKAEYRSLI